MRDWSEVLGTAGKCRCRFALAYLITVSTTHGARLTVVDEIASKTELLITQQLSVCGPCGL